MGYVSYDCFQYFEPSSATPLTPHHRIPESLLMIFDTIVVFDHLHHLIKVVTHFEVDSAETRVDMEKKYERLCGKLNRLGHVLSAELPPKVPFGLDGNARFDFNFW